MNTKKLPQTNNPNVANSSEYSANSPLDYSLPPLMSRAKWAAAIGLPETVVTAQAERGLWGAPIHIGKRVFVNVEAIRIAAADKAKHFTF